jgi:carboxyl-terminal processing protease
MILLYLICFCSKHDMNRTIVLQALDIAKEHSINTKNLNWMSIEKDILQQSNQLISEKDLYKILQSLINRLEDKHSYLITADGKRWQKTTKTSRVVTENSLPLNKLRNAKIAYIDIKPMSSAKKLNMNTYAEKLYNTIISSYKIDMTGWILDFRENTGGQLWPMLAGLSPLINSNIAGNAIYPNGNNWQWWAKDGKAGVGKNLHHQIESVNNQFIKKRPIAILISKQTASSGEASIISFIGQDNICLIGEQTRGLTTVNQPFKLANGAKLMLTTAYFGDRNQKIYPDGIEPDIIITNGTENEGHIDIQLKTAIEWLKKQK